LFGAAVDNKFGERLWGTALWSRFGETPHRLKKVTYMIVFLYQFEGGKKGNIGIVRGYTYYVIFSKVPSMTSHGNIFGGTLRARNYNIFLWDSQKINVIFLDPFPSPSPMTTL